MTTPYLSFAQFLRRLYRYLLITLGVLLAFVAVLLATFWVAALRRESKPRTLVAPASGRFVTGADLEIFVQEAGPADGPPVLLVHGTGAWGAIWRETIDVLASAGYRAIAIDLPPFGFSQRPLTPRYEDTAQASRIIAVLQALGLRRVTLIGHSFGARPTVEAALREPARIQLLVLVDAALNPSRSRVPPPRPPFLVRTTVSIPWIRDPLVAATLTNPLLTRRLLQQLILDPGDATDAQVQMIQDQFQVAGTTRALGLWLQEFLLGDATSLNQDPSRYSTLTMPTLLLWGQEDAITPLAQGQALRSLLPNAEMVTLASTGHIPAIENSKAFNNALLGFLTAHRPATPVAGILPPSSRVRPNQRMQPTNCRECQTPSERGVP